MDNKEPLNAANYCVSFIDLLGQRLEFQNEGLLPKYESEEEKKKFNDKVRNTIGRIYELQRASDGFLKGALEYKDPSIEQLQPNLKSIYDKIKEIRLKQQRWSDGIVHFVSLMEGDVKCPMGGVYTVMLSAGGLCFLGLAAKMPLRGSIDIAWGVELHEGELYGPAVAKAYELESEIAQYPRIVVGPEVVNYLIWNINNPDTDIYSQCNRQFAKTCYEMLAEDFDGYWIMHYLGDGFRKIVAMESFHQELYKESLSFIQEQRTKWKNEKNAKLLLRYNQLLSCFRAYPPSNSQEKNTQPDAGH